MDAAALFCNICPKRPKFSDVSHLLTHISSKAHLSHYFKLQVRSHQEQEAGDLLDEYDQWYKANNLAKLLSDRMASKETRKRKSLGKIPAPSSAPTTDAGSHSVPIVKTSSSHESLSDLIDPRLSGNPMPFDSNGDASYASSYITPVTSSFTPRSHPRTDYSQQSMGSPQTSVPYAWKQEREYDSGEETSLVMQATPLWSRRSGRAGRLLRGYGYDPFVDDNDQFGTPAPGIDKERADEIARLKGVLWPGMDIFDSATEQMRRKRNQKKDESILKMMEKTSLCVEPTELVFSPTGILRKQRVISGNVEDSSPLKGETPIPKRRLPRPKRVLAQMDSNAHIGQDRKRSKKAPSFSLRRQEPRENLSQSPVSTLPGRFGNSLFSGGDDYDELDMSFRGLDNRTRSGFSVFREDPAPYKSSFKEHHDNQLLMGDSFPPGFSRPESTSYNPFRPPPSSTYASNFAGKATRIPTDKENMEPLLNSNGRIDPIVGWHSPVMKRRAGDTGYSSQYLFGDAQRHGTSFEDDATPSGYSYNPLMAFSKMADENHTITPLKDNYKATPAPRAASEDGTISEVEEDDFERLYLDGSSS